MSILILGPFNRSLTSIIVSSCKYQYGCISVGASFMWLGHPPCTMCLNRHNSSFHPAALKIIWFLLAVTWNLLVSHVPLPLGVWSGHLRLPIWTSNWHKLFGRTFLYTTLRSYAQVLNYKHCNFGGVCVRIFTSTLSNASDLFQAGIVWHTRNSEISPWPKQLQLILIQFAHILSDMFEYFAHKIFDFPLATGLLHDLSSLHLSLRWGICSGPHTKCAIFLWDNVSCCQALLIERDTCWDE